MSGRVQLARDATPVLGGLDTTGCLLVVEVAGCDPEVEDVPWMGRVVSPHSQLSRKRRLISPPPATQAQPIDGACHQDECQPYPPPPYPYYSNPQGRQ